MADLADVTEGVARATSVRELELLRSITSGFASFGAAVRDSGLTDVQKSRVLAGLAEASRSLMDATNAYLFALNACRGTARPAAAASDGPATTAAG